MTHSRTGRAYTILELVIVLSILSILAGVAVPKLFSASDEAAIQATIDHLKTLALAVEMYEQDNGAWPADAPQGTMPAGLEPYLRQNLFAVPSPIGGVYDWNPDVGNSSGAISISGTTAESETMQALDGEIDDNDMGAGGVQVGNVGLEEQLDYLIE